VAEPLRDALYVNDKAGRVHVHLRET
jgi:hypothetical protein